MKKLLMIFVVLLIAVSVYAASLTCNIDRGSLMWTGRTKTDHAVLLYEHKCLYNHYFWLTSEQMNQ
jgi:hypothetical protein